SWREGMPRSAIEAAAMGRALVLTDIRGCREVARHDQEAMLVPPRDPDALAGAIARLAADPALRDRLGSAARRRALENFSEAQVAERVVEHYRRLVGGPDLPGHPLGVPPTPRVVGAAPGPAVVRPATPEDAAAMARLHADGMPDAFLPALGLRFLARLYRALATDPEAGARGGEGVDGVVGFAAGVTSVGGFYRRFARGHGPAGAPVAHPGRG